jgi:hypothetical protein
VDAILIFAVDTCVCRGISHCAIHFICILTNKYKDTLLSMANRRLAKFQPFRIKSKRLNVRCKNMDASRNSVKTQD